MGKRPRHVVGCMAQDLEIKGRTEVLKMADLPDSGILTFFPCFSTY